MATTPDGFTPNDEVVCDSLKGATPGLYGLCVAYCEGTDSPEDLTTEEKIASLPRPSTKLLANYNRMRKAGDPQMPCATYQTSTTLAGRRQLTWPVFWFDFMACFFL